LQKPGLDELRAETEANHQAFRKLIGGPRAEAAHPVALMRQLQLVGFFATRSDALAEGRRRFGDQVYSVHTVRRMAVEHQSPEPRADPASDHSQH
jgi:hypothetical protein